MVPAKDATGSGGFGPEAKRLIRTAQNYFPALKHVKDWVYHYARRVLRMPHDGDFQALTLLPDRPDDLYLDIGANHGQSIASIRLFKPNVPIVSFEPHPVLADRLKELYGRTPGVEIRHLGLGNEAGELTLYTPSYRGFVYDGLASFDRESALRWLNPEMVIGFDPQLLTVATRTCPVARLDDLGLSPTFVKIDVQGLEYEVLAGGAETLRRCRPVLFIEDVEGDARIPALLSPLGYIAHWFDGQALVRGRSPRENNILLTEAHISALPRGAVRHSEALPAAPDPRADAAGSVMGGGDQNHDGSRILRAGRG